MGVIFFLLLSCLGLGITAQAQDCSRPVLGANMGLKDILLQAFPNGIRVSLTCDVGYMSAGGSAFIACTDGTWSPVRLKCERRNCGTPFEVQNGHLTFPQGTEFGDTVQFSCDPGFILVGNSELTCGVNGWIGREPTCAAVTCDPPPQIEDGSFSPYKDVYEYKESVHYTCANGLDLVGLNAVSCSETGTWPDPPSCKRVQCSEPDIKNAVWVSGPRPPYKYKATVTYECRSGYRMEGSATLTCDSNNNWTPELPNCISQDCSRPVLGANFGLKGTDRLLQAFPNGIRVSLTCDVGYVSAGGSTFITCTDGTWSPVRLKCERRNCGEPFQVQNGHLTFPQGTEFGDTVQYSCDPGFILVGSRELTCGAQGWIGREPTCVVVTCDPPPQIEEGSFSPDKDVYEYREVVRYTCTNGLDLVGSNSVSCSETGTWPDPPSCKRVQCSEPDIKNADWVSGSRPPYKYKATVIYKCRSGYRMEGSATLTCDINNNWTPELPNCKQILTPAKPTTTATPPGNNGNVLGPVSSSTLAVGPQGAKPGENGPEAPSTHGNSMLKTERV